MRTSSFLLCLLSVSLVSGITVSAYNELSKVNFTESDNGLVNHGHGHHGRNATESHNVIKPAVVEVRKLLETDVTIEENVEDIVIDDVDYDDDDSTGRRLLRRAGGKTKASKAAPTVAAKTLTKEEDLLNTWLATTAGVSAAEFCASLGIKDKFDIYNGCLFDMYTTKDKQIAKESAVAAEEFSTKGRVTVGKRFCVASGDPHCTNYDGEFFHIQEPGMYTITRSFNGDFEVQEQMRKNGANKPGVPSCMIGAVVRYKRTRIEIDVAKNNKILVNGVDTDLPNYRTITIGGIQIRYGKQNIEWRGDKTRTTGLKLTTPEGFGVLVTGGYCGVLETSVPEIYYGKMSGICGNGNGVRDNNDYVTPSGVVVDVKRGTKSWEMSGYGGPTSYLSKWQLAWKPYSTDCLFKSGCETGGALRQPLVTPAPAPVPVAVASTKVAASVVVAAPVVAPVAVAKPPVVAASPAVVAVKAASPISVADEIKAAHLTAVAHLNKFQQKIVTVMSETGAEQRKFEQQNKKSYDDATLTLKEDALKLKTTTEVLQSLQKQVVALNATIHVHYRQLIADSSYLKKLETIKPSFLKSLDDVSKQINGLRSTVLTNLVKDGYKSEMVGLLSHIHFKTHNITGYVATAFMAHYNKYKQLLQADNSGYDADLKKLNQLVETYRIQAQKVADVTAEYNKVLSIVAKVKATYDTSVAENADLDDLVKRVLKLLTTKSCVA